MIKLNLTAYLRAKGVKLPRNFMRDADEALKMNRTTLTKYLRHSDTINSPDLRVLSKLCEYLCARFPNDLNFEELLKGCFVWESFQTVFAMSSVSYYVGALIVPEQNEDDEMVSLRDRAAVQSVHQLHSSEHSNVTEPEMKIVPYRISVDSDGRTSESDITAARALLSNDVKNVPVAHVMVGSCKVHLLTIVHLADMFNVDPNKKMNHRMPIGLIPRPGEIVPPCFRNTQYDRPGLLWRNEKHNWEHLGFEEDEKGIKRDAGFVIIDFHPMTNELNIILFGFSGEGTKAVGRALALEPLKIEWPPKTPSGDALVDIYAFQFSFETTKEGREIHTRTSRMDESILLHYLPPTPVSRIKQISQG